MHYSGTLARCKVYAAQICRSGRRTRRARLAGWPAGSLIGQEICHALRAAVTWGLGSAALPGADGLRMSSLVCDDLPIPRSLRARLELDRWIAGSLEILVMHDLVETGPAGRTAHGPWPTHGKRVWIRPLPLTCQSTRSKGKPRQWPDATILCPLAVLARHPTSSTPSVPSQEGPISRCVPRATPQEPRNFRHE